MCRTNLLFFHYSGSVNWKMWEKKAGKAQICRPGRLSVSNCMCEWEGCLLWCPGWLQKLSFLPLFLPSALTFGGPLRFTTSFSSFWIQVFAFNICTKATAWSLMHGEPRLSQGTHFTGFDGHALCFLRNTAGIPVFAGCSHTALFECCTSPSIGFS